ncbi:MAG: hypothetical protein JWN34_5253 [Bryobacterales bacterium]|nr:hypothetical protein [Bryobacterales bacterium]
MSKSGNETDDAGCPRELACPRGGAGTRSWKASLLCLIGLWLRASCCAIQFEDRFQPAFGDSVSNAVLLIFAATEFAFHLDVCSLLQSGSKLGELAEGYTAVPFGSRFPRSLRRLPGTLCRHGKRGDCRVVVARLRLWIIACEADESESVEVHDVFSFCPSVLGHSRASGHRSQGKEVLFWGNQNGGARTGRRRQAKQRLRRPPGAGIGPEAVPRKTGQKRNKSPQLTI